MTKDDFFGLTLIAYAAVACVVFGFFVKTFIAAGPPAVAFGFVVAGLWPVSGLVWLGVWLA